MVRQGFWSSPHHPPDPWARLLFMAMWNFADDYGVGSCGTRELLGFAFPNDRNITEDYLEILLRQVGEAYGVTYYTVGGRPFYAIPSWPLHQKVPHPSKTRNPGVDEAEQWLYQDLCDISSDSHESHMTPSVKPRQVVAKLSPKYKEKEKEKEKVKDPPPPSGGQHNALRGTRLPDNWQPPDEVMAKLASRYPHVRLDLILDEFLNYWTALPGPKALKLDWVKTFTNRVAVAAPLQRFQAIDGQRPTGTEVAFVKLSQLAEKYSQEDMRSVELPTGSEPGDDEGQGVLAIG